MADENSIAARVLTAGEKTSEFKITQNTKLWGTILIVAGSITSFLPPIIDSIRAIPGAEQNSTVTIILSILGVLIAISGAVMKAIATASYNSGRSLLKAAAIRDVSPKTPAPPSI